MRRYIQAEDTDKGTVGISRDVIATTVNPILNDLSDRLGHLIPLNDGSCNKFDVKALYDHCMANFATNTHEVSYDRLNEILRLDANELTRFCRKMNEKSGLDLNSSSISEQGFVCYFLEAMTYTRNCNPDSDQITALFNEIFERQSSICPVNSINMLGLYESSLSSFLSQQQICSLLRYLRRSIRSRTTTLDDESLSTSATINASSYLDVSLSSMEIEDSSTVVVASRIDCARNCSLMNMFRSRFGRSLIGVGTTDKNIINRDDFIRLYPEALRCTLDETSFSPTEIQGIDIFFENLSLDIIARGKRTTIVDRVSGRIQRGAMTALMGCSGSGKTSLLNALCGRGQYSFY
jgi:ABC-type multidrug transport system fused ATPase/permease subunit